MSNEANTPSFWGLLDATALNAAPFGVIAWQVNELGLERLMFRRSDPDIEMSPHPLVDEVKEQLVAYFSGALKDFDVPLASIGTSFQNKCWDALQTIKYGETIAYAEQAKRVGKPTATRAVANANGANPIPIIIPCHRVIASDGSLGGYGPGVDKKQWLLMHELKNV